MKKRKQTNREIKYIKSLYTFFIIGLTVLFSTSFLWNRSKEKESSRNFALIEGLTSFEKDVLYRRWSAMRGGVYVPVTKQTPPNPHLMDIPNRDITTNDGKKLTLVNPAYMTRQVHEIAKGYKGVQGHITSLLPIRQENKPDEWEKKALEAFENGKTQIYSIEQINETEHLRFMKPLIAEKACLKCHAKQGYQEGDIRGGISVSIPMERYNAITNSRIKDLAVSHAVIYFIFLFLGTFSYKKFLTELIHRNQMHEKLIKSEELLQAQNAEYIKLNKEYKRQNKELHVAKEKAEESDRMKTAFIQNMSHEIRTPMNAIVGFSDMLFDEKVNIEKRKNFKTIIQNSTHQLLSIVNDILTISALQAGKEKIHVEPVCIHSLLSELVSIFRMKATSQNIDLILDNFALDEQCDIVTDKTKLTQILTNLLSNALKFTEQGKIQVGYTFKGSLLEVYVADTGIGIDANAQEFIFDRFKQADTSISKKYGGTGLGLSISKGLTELLGGSIRMESEAGMGSTFYVCIPSLYADTETETQKVHHSG